MPADLAPKTRPDSLAGELRQAGLYDEFCVLMFEQALGYADLLAWLEKHNIARGSNAGLSRFHDAERSRWALERGKRILQETAAMLPEEVEESTRRLVLQRTFELAASPQLSDAAVLKLRDQELAIRESELKQRRHKQDLEVKTKALELAERRVEMLEAKIKNVADTVGNTKLSPEEREQRIKAALGLA